MTYSINQMEERTKTLRERLDELEGMDPPGIGTGRFYFLRYRSSLKLALEIIAELAGRLSAAEGLLVEERRQTRVAAGYSRRKLIDG